MQKYTFFVNSKTFYTFSESNKQYNSTYSMTVLYKIRRIGQIAGWPNRRKIVFLHRSLKRSGALLGSNPMRNRTANSRLNGTGSA